MRDACPTFKPLMTEALFGDLPPGDQTRLDDHLKACDACAAEFASLQSTLEVASAYERPQRSDAYWDAFSERLYERVEQEPSAAPADAAVPSWTDRLATWWASRPALLPVTGMQWAFHGALALLLIAAGLTLGRMTAPAPTPSDPLAETAGPATDPLLVPINAGVNGANIEPRLTGVEDITYDVTDGAVEIRYNTTNDVVVRDKPDDPKIQRLLRAALLDDNNPSSRLHAVKTLEAARPAADDEVISALTYLVRDESSPDMRLRAVRALRRLHQTAPMSESTRGVLVNVLLDADLPALRIEALESLTNDTMLSSPAAINNGAHAVPSFLHQAQSDSNGYVRYRAGEMLQQIRTDAGDS
ncbi:anti-sigma factor family protein [Longibacter sp.]|uniref:anti-sigma factor family protein n=1 Tax=Longibacter sp. TaxID=2045415 RepID=UPI003EB9212C